jgi:hypothetical protein
MIATVLGWACVTVDRFYEAKAVGSGGVVQATGSDEFDRQ